MAFAFIVGTMVARQSPTDARLFFASHFVDEESKDE
jgi:hypothetical protein